MALTKEHKRKISESNKKNWAKGKRKSPKQCNKCGAFLRINHNCSKVKEKQSKAKKNNPTNYWLGKKRPGLGKILSEKKKGTPCYAVGENHHSWKGGTKTHWRKQARLTMEKKLKRKLTSSEIIHHIDGDCSNNNLDNLLLTNRSEHIKIHLSQGDIHPGVRG